MNKYWEEKKLFKQSKRRAGVLRRAFTITELVIVIAVIAILAAVLIPTFANVIENSKKSHDTQYEHEINVALAGYTNSHGAPPQDYEELMLALADYDLCDTSNPFLLATKLKQDNTYLVWYPSTNTVSLVNDDEYVIVPNTTVGLGNAVTVMPRQATGADTLLGYRLCNTGLPDSVTLANEYLTIYEKYNGNLVAYVQGEGIEHIQNVAGSMQNAGWGNAFIGSMNNAQEGYIYNEATANNIREQAKTSSDITIPITIPGGNYAAASETEKTAVQQSVRSGLATIATLSNSADTAAVLENKTISFEPEGGDPNTALEGVVVDMSGAQINSIGTTYRKAYDGSKVDDGIAKVETGTVSVNFGGVELKGMKVTANSLIASGAEYQGENDNGYPGGSYAFTYGLFGTVHADEGDTVTISNLKISDVNANLTGATQMVNGQSVVAVSDMAGIVVGYTQGNVVLENIEINGSSVGGEGLFEGYDGVAALVGRAYGNQSAGYTDHLTLRNCTVRNLQINGQRRAAGFVSYAGRGIVVDIENCSMENVSITSRRNDDKVKDMYVGVFGHFAKDTELNVNGVNLTNVACTANVVNEGSTVPIQNITKDTTPFLDYAFYMQNGNTYLPLVYTDGKVAASTQCVEVNFGETGLTLTFAGSTYTAANKTFEFGEGKSPNVTNVFTKAA